MPKEMWRSVMFKNREQPYEVSDRGRVRRSLVAPQQMGSVPGRILKLTITKNGYNRVNLQYRWKSKVYLVHRLVATAFISPCPRRLQVNHLNGKKTDNRSENLEWVTPKQNMRHAFEIGLIPDRRGEGSNCSKLTNREVYEIRRRVRAGESQTHLGKCFRISRSSIWLIANKRTWTHLPEVEKERI